MRVHQERDQAAPAGLVRRAQARAGLAVVVFVEEQMVAKMRVVLQQVAGPQRGPAAIFPPQIKRSQPFAQIIGNFCQCRQATGADRELYFEVVAEIIRDPKIVAQSSILFG